VVRSRELAAAAVAVLLLAGCTPRGGVAAYVDGVPITEGTLSETATDIAPLSQAPVRSILHALIVSPAWIEAARAAGLGVSEQDGRDVLDDLAEQAGADIDPASYGPGVIAIAQVLAAQEKAAAQGKGQALAEAADALVLESTIEVNPRYGEWSGQGVAPVLHPWLVGLPPGIR
jgi:hypothetical protein